MSLSSAEKCPDCGRWSYPGDPGCDCWADAMTEDEWMAARGIKRADATEDRRQMPTRTTPASDQFPEHGLTT